MNRKPASIGVICLFLALTVAPSVGVTPMQSRSSSAGTVTGQTNSDGSTLYVGGSGPDNYTSIQAAVDDSSDGDTVFVYSRVYNESILVDKRIDVVGAERNTTVIDAAAGYALNVTGDGVHISTFTIRNGRYPYAAVILYRTSDVAISQCNLYGNRYAVSIYSSDNNTVSRCRFMENTVGLELRSTNDTVISNCTISDNKGGVYLINSDGNTVSRCSIHSNPWVGISLESSSHNIISGNDFVDDSIRIRGETSQHFLHEIADNTVNGLPLLYINNEREVVLEDMRLGEVILVNCTDAVLHNVTVTDGEMGIMAAYCRNATIGDCTISDNDEGISLYFSSHILLSHNTVSGSNESGISLYSCHNNSVTKNHISNTDSDALYLWKSCHNNVSLNEIHGNGMGILVFSYSDYNNVYGNEVVASTYYGISIQGGSFNEVAHNVVRGSREWCGICTAKGWTQGNIISNNEVVANNWVGIDIEGIENVVSRNNISHNTRYGIMLSSFSGTECKRNVIQENNFRENGNHAFFDVSLLSLNMWSHNYWQGWPPLLPKPIYGECSIPITPRLRFRVPWLNVDLHPAREPIDWWST